MSRTWIEFWNTDHNIYASPRHLEVYYQILARDLLDLMPAHRPLRLLDFGCGDALAAPSFAEAGIDVLLYDPVPRVIARVKSRYDGIHGIHVLDEAPHATLAQESIDVVVIYSVLQYMSKDDFTNLLSRLSLLLKKGGIVLIGDVVPTGAVMRDVFDLLSAAVRYGFFIDACKSLIKTYFSDYRAVRHAQGFTTYTPKEISSLVQDRGFIVELLPPAGLSKSRIFVRAVKHA